MEGLGGSLYKIKCPLVNLIKKYITHSAVNSSRYNIFVIINPSKITEYAPVKVGNDRMTFPSFQNFVSWKNN